MDPSTSSMLSGSGLLAVSGSSIVRAEPNRGQRPHRTMGAWGLIPLRRYIMGARTPPVRAHIEPIPIPFCLKNTMTRQGPGYRCLLWISTWSLSTLCNLCYKVLNKFWLNLLSVWSWVMWIIRQDVVYIHWRLQGQHDDLLEKKKDSYLRNYVCMYLLSAHRKYRIKI